LALAIVVLLSRNGAAIVAISLGLAAIAASAFVAEGWLPIARRVLHRGGEIITWSALIGVVVQAVYAPGRITLRRLRGAAVVYLSIALLFASIYGLIWDLAPDAFANLRASPDGYRENADLMYFSLTTLTTTGYGDILPIRSFCPQFSQFRVCTRGVLYRDHSYPPRDAGTGRSPPLTSSCNPIRSPMNSISSHQRLPRRSPLLR
jgi:hypothetical protein